MFNTSKEMERYVRDEYTMAEALYNEYMQMRAAVCKVENKKYSGDIDSMVGSEDFKRGFIAGVKVMSALFMDM